MKRTFALLVALVSVLALVQPGDADARRIGGGRSLGAQRSIAPAPAPSTAAPSTGAASNPVMPAPSGVAPARPVTPAAAAPASGLSRWLGPIAGIAAGLGLAALFAKLGLSGGFGSLLLILLGVGAVALIARALIARGMGASSAPARYSPQPANGPLEHVEPTVKRFEPAWGGTTPTTTAGRRLPPGFEPAPFLAEAKRQFNRLQAAYDRGDRSLLTDVLTPDMIEEISRDIGGRGPHIATEVVSLDADLLDVATEGDQHWASVRFKGLTREDGKPTPEPFDEVWNLVKPVDGASGWRLAGIQQYA